MATPLTPAQLDFLRFHAEGVRPHAWEWLDADGRRALSPQEAAQLRATRRRAMGGPQVLIIGAEDLEAISGFWRPDGIFTVNDAGLALLAANPADPDEVVGVRAGTRVAA